MIVAPSRSRVIVQCAIAPPPRYLDSIHTPRHPCSLAVLTPDLPWSRVSRALPGPSRSGGTSGACSPVFQGSCTRSSGRPGAGGRPRSTDPRSFSARARGTTPLWISVRPPGAGGRRMIVWKPSLTANSGSGRPASVQRRIMSRVPVPIRSMQPARYIGSARSGFAGTDPWACRSFSRVRDGGSVPGFQTSRRSAKSITCTRPFRQSFTAPPPARSTPGPAASSTLRRDSPAPPGSGRLPSPSRRHRTGRVRPAPV